MEKNLESYVKIYNMIEPKICEDIIKELEECKSWQQHKFYNYSENIAEPQSGNEELSVTSEQISYNPYVMEKIWQSLHEYFTDLNFSWFNSWHGFSLVRYNRYKKNKKMAEHCDHIYSLFDGPVKGIPTLSVLGVLNDNYEGGEFIMYGDTEIKLKQGDIMVFPSIFLYPHRVDPVTKGTRYSLVSWAW
jgi:hypothetical protein